MAHRWMMVKLKLFLPGIHLRVLEKHVVSMVDKFSTIATPIIDCLKNSKSRWNNNTKESF